MLGSSDSFSLPVYINGSREQPHKSKEGKPAKKVNPLEAYTVNLLERAARGKIDPLVGRAAELERTVQILCRRR